MIEVITSVFELRGSALLRRSLSGDPQRPVSSSWHLSEISYPDQVVGGHPEGEDPVHEHRPAMFDLAQTSDSFEPAEGMLDLFAFHLTHCVSRMTSRPPIDSAALAGVVLRDVWRDLDSSKCGDEGARVVSLVRSQRGAVSSCSVFPSVDTSKPATTWTVKTGHQAHSSRDSLVFTS